MASVTQQQANVSKTESMVLIKNMIRISISSICYFRDLFPNECYKNKQYGNVQIHQLQAAQKDENDEVVVSNQDAFLLTQWLEKGVFLALESEYLSSMIFAIYTSHPKTKADLLLESYEFRVSYAGLGRSAKLNDAELYSKESVKHQAAKFIRSLTEFTSTLGELPPERWLTVQLKYTPQTPPDYEPEFFGPASSSLLSGLRLPLVINVGSLDTGDLALKFKYAGLDSLLFEDLCKENQTVNKQPVPPIFVGKAHPVSVGSDEQTKAQAKRGNLDLTNEFNRMEVAESLEEAPKLLERVKNFILKEKCPIISRCAAQMGLDVETVRKSFQELHKEGVLVQKGKAFSINSKHMNKAPAPFAPKPKVISSLEQEKMELQDTPQLVPSTIIEPIDEFTPEETRLEPLHELPPPAKPMNIARKQQPLALSTTKQAAVVEDFKQPEEHHKQPERQAVPEEQPFDMSQTSEAEAAKGKKRKISAIREPIHMLGSNKKRRG